MTSRTQPAPGRRHVLVSLAAGTAALAGAAHSPGIRPAASAMPSRTSSPVAPRGGDLTEHMKRYYQRARY